MGNIPKGFDFPISEAAFTRAKELRTGESKKDAKGALIAKENGIGKAANKIAKAVESGTPPSREGIGRRMDSRTAAKYGFGGSEAEDAFKTLTNPKTMGRQVFRNRANPLFDRGAGQQSSEELALDWYDFESGYQVRNNQALFEEKQDGEWRDGRIRMGGLKEQLMEAVKAKKKLSDVELAELSEMPGWRLRHWGLAHNLWTEEGVDRMAQRAADGWHWLKSGWDAFSSGGGHATVK